MWCLFINEMMKRTLKIIGLFYFFQFSEKTFECLHTMKCTLFIENQLLSITHDIYQSLDEGYQVRGMFLDISKEFGKVWHKGLLPKSEWNGINETLLQILTDFLKLWKQRIVLNDHYSSWSDALAGVLQGSFLNSFLLFFLH